MRVFKPKLLDPLESEARMAVPIDDTKIELWNQVKNVLSFAKNTFGSTFTGAPV